MDSERIVKIRDFGPIESVNLYREKSGRVCVILKRSGDGACMSLGGFNSAPERIRGALERLCELDSKINGRWSRADVAITHDQTSLEVYDVMADARAALAEFKFNDGNWEEWRMQAGEVEPGWPLEPEATTSTRCLDRKQLLAAAENLAGLALQDGEISVAYAPGDIETGRGTLARVAKEYFAERLGCCGEEGQWIVVRYYKNTDGEWDLGQWTTASDEAVVLRALVLRALEGG